MLQNVIRNIRFQLEEYILVCTPSFTGVIKKLNVSLSKTCFFMLFEIEKINVHTVLLKHTFISIHFKAFLAVLDMALLKVNSFSTSLSIERITVLQSLTWLIQYNTHQHTDSTPHSLSQTHHSSQQYMFESQQTDNFENRISSLNRF